MPADPQASCGMGDSAPHGSGARHTPAARHLPWWKPRGAHPSSRPHHLQTPSAAPASAGEGAHLCTSISHKSPGIWGLGSTNIQADLSPLSPQRQPQPLALQLSAPPASCAGGWAPNACSLPVRQLLPLHSLSLWQETLCPRVRGCGPEWPFLSWPPESWPSTSAQAG